MFPVAIVTRFITKPAVSAQFAIALGNPVLTSVGLHKKFCHDTETLLCTKFSRSHQKSRHKISIFTSSKFQFNDAHHKDFAVNIAECFVGVNLVNIHSQ